MPKIKYRKLKAEPPKWWFYDFDGCWWCKKTPDTCGGCKKLKNYTYSYKKSSFDFLKKL